MNSFREIIDAWPSRKDFVADMGVTDVNAQVMYHRDSVSSRRWATLVPAAQKRGIPVSYEMLAGIKAKTFRKQQELTPTAPVRRGAGATGTGVS